MILIRQFLNWIWKYKWWILLVVLIVIILLVLYNIYYKSKPIDFINRSTINTEIKLGDNGKVHLAPRASIRLVSDTSLYEDIYMMKGLGKVTWHDLEKEVVLVATLGSIRMKSGVVMIKQDSTFLEAYVLDGAAIISKESSKSILNGLNISKGEVGRVDIVNPGILKKINRNINYDSWLSGGFSLDGLTLHESISILEGHYNVSISIPTDQIGDCRVQGQFKGESIEVILNSIATPINLKVKKRGDNYELYGLGCLR